MTLTFSVYRLHWLEYLTSESPERDYSTMKAQFCWRYLMPVFLAHFIIDTRRGWLVCRSGCARASPLQPSERLRMWLQRLLIIIIATCEKCLCHATCVCTHRIRRRQHAAQDHIDYVLLVFRLHSSGHCTRRPQLQQHRRIDRYTIFLLCAQICALCRVSRLCVCADNEQYSMKRNMHCSAPTTSKQQDSAL